LQEPFCPIIAVAYERHGASSDSARIRIHPSCPEA
jgi:hypothetical protein